MQSQATSHDHTPSPLPPQRRLHPLIGAAAVAVVIASLTAVAAVTGVLPISKANPDLQAQQSQPATQAPQGPLPVTTQTAPPPGSTTRPPVYDDGQPAASRQNATASQPTQAAPRTAPARQAAQRDSEPRASHRADTERPAAKGSPYAGRIVAVTPIQAQKPNTSGLGALGGAVVGGLLGNQVGKGNGRIVGTVVGAVGGGVAGNQIEKAVSKDTHYEVRVRMDDGSHRTFTYEKDPAVQVGERVHMENGALVRG
ncbi:glycine zipper 2TM domain-containing protein [Cupriavidus consociatus]|uniref:glycine zipper 2TM domain-containing protein n=1 Tax=Cupriavidus consociatus TaxID=2821357 RepID=UPI001AEB1AD5|nr:MULTISPECIES: glycine zipper 2TM domain-containing protein [unclassified Cupriavidus]MBP0620327.1 glycine zipper 2TM domain-containing protein [Cupriavidus sp. LEh25]MDK2656983.1 glycine zipper 2TM domain-containing protein [Cupriavidus sp. LEh21]